MVVIAALISIPIGILAAIYLAVLGPYSKLAGVSRFVAKTLIGSPSILAGVFTYAVLMVAFGYSRWPAVSLWRYSWLPTVVGSG